MTATPENVSTKSRQEDLAQSTLPPTKGAFPLLSFAKTLWLFTESDFATFVFPDTVFGIFAALSGPLLTGNASPDLLQILRRLPYVVLWNWLNLLIFDLANQRHPESILEDSINKPWRPLPSGRISVSQTRHLLLIALPVVLGINYCLGAWEETILLFTLTWMYNDLGGGDDGFIVRNIIIAVAFSQYNKGALRVATGENAVSPAAWWWLAVTSGVIGTTMQVQDMKDQEGDRAKNRRTAPLVIGDGAARWTIAIPTAIWSFACPIFWRLSFLGYVLPVSIGMIIVFRILLLRSFIADKRTWWLWAAWTGIIWMTPLFKDYSVFVRFLHNFRS
ncbi:UbiA prenyltransferase family-domain-containing protein [Talaromyces proteolyticus]|uniref:UbiA prenyltransferase family-domain-containing protein n=1 Tax=Talaromyces proteolyticus TaxID=1131652 RepID=A0AAD4KXQ1_9EURO|nr:UbiA prenyltransferase family-domain-containing protein [Talaromyces proteolyticus]KAH8703480.1 UbiA prenyltransferase family-domain-containing protein [Talaromyces proteolyticus]